MIGFAAFAAVGLQAVAAYAGVNLNDEAVQKRLFGRALAKTAIHACFSRVYDASHLASHPRQKVRTMVLLLTANPPPDKDSVAGYAIGVGVTFRKPGSHLNAYGGCGGNYGEARPGDDNLLYCGADCDGGSIHVSLKDQKSVLVEFPENAQVFSDRTVSPNPAKQFGADDKVFRLDKAPLSDCLTMAADPMTSGPCGGANRRAEGHDGLPNRRAFSSEGATVRVKRMRQD
jgi:hypothetical protein